MRKTKIICTLGPSTDKDGVLRELVANGMNVARFNFSHGSYEEHKGRLDMLKAIRTELGKPVAALLDTKGPEIRLKEFKNGVEMLEAGQTFTLTTREVEGTKEICSITYKDLPQDVHEGGTIMLDDGLIKLAIKSVSDTDIVCEVLNSGKIKTKKGVNVPGVHLSMPYLSQRDRDDIIFGIQQGFDFIAASFVRTAQDVYDIRNLLNEYDSHIRIIAKIENREGVNNIDSILAAADAVMVARGDLGVEIDFTELPGIQKDIIDRFKGNEDFVFLPVSRGETRETVAAFREKMGYTFPMGLDPEQKIYRLYASNYIPRNFLIGKDGKVISATIGYEAPEFDELILLIERQLNSAN